MAKQFLSMIDNRLPKIGLKGMNDTTVETGIFRSQVVLKLISCLSTITSDLRKHESQMKLNAKFQMGMNAIVVESKIARA